MFVEREAERARYKESMEDAMTQAIAASRRLQNMIEVDNQSPWLLPPIPPSEPTGLMQVNLECLHADLSKCTETVKCVSRDKSSPRGEYLDKDVTDTPEDVHVIRQPYVGTSSTQAELVVPSAAEPSVEKWEASKLSTSSTTDPDSSEMMRSDSTDQNHPDGGSSEFDPEHYQVVLPLHAIIGSSDDGADIGSH